MSTFERYLTLWVALCIAVGVALGHFTPNVFHAIGGAEIAKVNLPVAALICPDCGSLRSTSKRKRC